MLRSHLIALVLAFFALGAQGEETKKVLLGEWEFVSGERNGKALPAKDYAKEGLSIDEKEFTIISQGKKFRRHHYAIDDSAKPKSIALKTIDTPAIFKSSAIFELDGDTLKICFSSNEKHPGKFVTIDDGREQIWVLKRKK